ncbi:uncharacterized protein LOC134834055 [Culicoides brevitarsis]|uniref:uncharacterized protein LOC134834055 n=1 Tax=Culicoides brevitarsis TaxID=469753 RepID=UPI00307BE6B3
MDFLELGKLLLITESQVETCEKDLLLMKDSTNAEKLNSLLQQMETCRNTTSVYSKLVKNIFDRIFAKINTVEKALKARLEQEAPKEIPMDDNILIDVSDSGDEILNPFILELVEDPRLEKPKELGLFDVTLEIIPWYRLTNEIQSPSPSGSMQEVSELTPEKIETSTPNRILKDPRLNPAIKSFIYASPMPKNDQNGSKNGSFEEFGGNSCFFARKKSKSTNEITKNNQSEAQKDENLEKFKELEAFSNSNLTKNVENGDKTDQISIKIEDFEPMENNSSKKNEKSSNGNSNSEENLTENGNSDQIDAKNEDLELKQDPEDNIPLSYFQKISKRELDSLKFDETSLFFASKRAKRAIKQPKRFETASHAIQKMKKCSVVLTRCDLSTRKSL